MAPRPASPPSKQPPAAAATEPARECVAPDYDFWYHKAGSEQLVEIAANGLQPPDGHKGKRNFKHTPGTHAYLFGNLGCVSNWDRVSFFRDDVPIALRCAAVDSAKLRPDPEMVATYGDDMSLSDWEEWCAIAHWPQYASLNTILERLGTPITDYVKGKHIKLSEKRISEIVDAMTPAEHALWLQVARENDSFGAVMHEGPIAPAQIEVRDPATKQWIPLTGLDLDHLAGIDHEDHDAFKLKRSSNPPLAPLNAKPTPAAPKRKRPAVPGVDAAGK